MTKPARVEITEAEYSRADFDHDADAVAIAEATREAVAERARQWDRGNSIDMARRVARMRDSHHWRGPGTKDSDREFYEWIVARGTLNSMGWAITLLMAGRILPVFDAAGEKLPMGNFPVGASQIRDLGSSWYRAHPRSVIDVWTAAVEDAGGQPSKDLVAARARRHKADLESTEQAGALPYEQRAMHRKLAAIRKRLIKLHQEDAAPVETFLRELSMSIRGESWPSA